MGYVRIVGDVNETRGTKETLVQGASSRGASGGVGGGGSMKWDDWISTGAVRVGIIGLLGGFDYAF